MINDFLLFCPAFLFDVSLQLAATTSEKDGERICRAHFSITLGRNFLETLTYFPRVFFIIFHEEFYGIFVGEDINKQNQGQKLLLLWPAIRKRHPKYKDEAYLMLERVIEGF